MNKVVLLILYYNTRREDKTKKVNPTWDPPLKAKKPKSRINPPNPAKGTECPGISIGPLLEKRPNLGFIK